MVRRWRLRPISRRLRLYILTCAAVLAVTSAASADLLLTGAGKKPGGGGGGYTGPGDLKTFSAWGGLYAYSAATRGTNAVQLCDSGDANCVNVVSDATTGLVPNAPTVGSGACNNSTHICTIKTIYDQAGAGTYNWTQATESRRAVFTASCIGSIPCAFFNGGGGQGYNSAGSLTAAAWSLYSVFDFTGASVALSMAENSSSVNIRYSAGINQVAVQGGFFNPVTASDNTWHVIQGVQDPGSLTAVDATQTSGSIGSATFGGNIYLGDLCIACGDPVTGYALGFGVGSSRFSGSDLTSLNNNAHSILGF